MLVKITEDLWIHAESVVRIATLDMPSNDGAWMTFVHVNGGESIISFRAETQRSARATAKKIARTVNNALEAAAERMVYHGGDTAPAVEAFNGEEHVNQETAD